MPKFTFEKKLTYDGVVIIASAVSILLWMGGFKRQVDTLQSSSDAHTVQLETVKATVQDVKTDVAAVKSDVAVLSAVVVERTGKPLK